MTLHGLLALKDLPPGRYLISLHDGQIQLNFRVVQILCNHPVLLILKLLFCLFPDSLPLFSCAI